MTILDQVRLGKFTLDPDVATEFSAEWTGTPPGILEGVVPIDIGNIVDWMLTDWADMLQTRHNAVATDLFQEVRLSFAKTWWEWDVVHPVSQKRRNRAILTIDGYNHDDWFAFLFERDGNKTVLTHAWGFAGLSNVTSGIKYYLPIMHGQHVFDNPDDQAFIHQSTIPVLLAQSLMHCKNVVVEQKAKPPKLAKSFRRKHHGVVPAPFHSVKIEPMKTVMRSAGGVGHLGIKKAMHIVRGNFATYTEEKPLFGNSKNVGRFFRASHVRGDVKIGARPASYQVKKPSAAA
jgi:hypothetical protein